MNYRKEQTMRLISAILDFILFGFNVALFTISTYEGTPRIFTLILAFMWLIVGILNLLSAKDD